MTFCKPCCAALLALLLLAPLSGCAQKTAMIQAEELPPIKTIAVLPVEIVTEGATGSRSPKEAAQLAKGQAVMNALLAERFSKQADIVLISEAERDLFGKDLALCRTTAVATICRTHKTDAVLILTLYRFAEREGGEYSVASPASVNFDYKLILAKTGQTLCSGVFDETQQAVFDNLFRIFDASRRGFKWISAEALARDGLQQKLNGCPSLGQ